MDSKKQMSGIDICRCIHAKDRHDKFGYCLDCDCTHFVDVIQRIQV